MNHSIKLMAWREPFRGPGISIFASSRSPSDDLVGVFEPLTCTLKKDEGIMHVPILVIEENAAQELMDSLWNIGIRPSNGEGSVGQIGAIKDHLHDLQRLVFNHNHPNNSSK